jgi:hypothetical protein
MSAAVGRAMARGEAGDGFLRERGRAGQLDEVGFAAGNDLDVDVERAVVPRRFLPISTGTGVRPMALVSVLLNRR